MDTVVKDEVCLVIADTVCASAPVWQDSGEKIESLKYSVYHVTQKWWCEGEGKTSTYQGW
jgi:hypothetical protein